MIFYLTARTNIALMTARTQIDRNFFPDVEITFVSPLSGESATFKGHRCVFAAGARYFFNLFTFTAEAKLQSSFVVRLPEVVASRSLELSLVERMIDDFYGLPVALSAEEAIMMTFLRDFFCPGPPEDFYTADITAELFPLFIEAASLFDVEADKRLAEKIRTSIPHAYDLSQMPPGLKRCLGLPGPNDFFVKFGNGVIQIWDAATKTLVRKVKVCTAGINVNLLSILLSPDRRYLVCSLSDRVSVFDLCANAEKFKIPCPGRENIAFDIAAAGKCNFQIIIVQITGLEVWDFASKTKIRSFPISPSMEDGILIDANNVLLRSLDGGDFSFIEEILNLNSRDYRTMVNVSREVSLRDLDSKYRIMYFASAGDPSEAGVLSNILELNDIRTGEHVYSVKLPTLPANSAVSKPHVKRISIRGEDHLLVHVRYKQRGVKFYSEYQYQNVLVHLETNSVLNIDSFPVCASAGGGDGFLVYVTDELRILDLKSGKWSVLVNGCDSYNPGVYFPPPDVEYFSVKSESSPATAE